MTGDLFAGWGPSIRLIDYNGGGSLWEWSETLEKAMQLEFETVIPGHSDVTDRSAIVTGTSRSSLPQINETGTSRARSWAS